MRLIKFTFTGIFVFIALVLIQGCENTERESKLEKMRTGGERFDNVKWNDNHSFTQAAPLPPEEDNTIDSAGNDFTSPIKKSIFRMADISIFIKVNDTKPDGRSWDGLSDPDIAGLIIFYDGTEVNIPEENNSFTTTVNVSDVYIGPGDPIKIFLEDRDIAIHDEIAFGEVIYEGGDTLSADIGSAHVVFTIL